MKISTNENGYSAVFKDRKEYDSFLGLVRDILDSRQEDEGTSNIDLDKLISDVRYYNDTVTVVHWKDGTTTKSRCQNNDTFNKELGLAMCIIRKVVNNRSYNKVFKKYACE